MPCFGGKIVGEAEGGCKILDCNGFASCTGELECEDGGVKGCSAGTFEWICGPDNNRRTETWDGDVGGQWGDCDGDVGGGNCRGAV